MPPPLHRRASVTAQSKKPAQSHITTSALASAVDSKYGDSSNSGMTMIATFRSTISTSEAPHVVGKSFVEELRLLLKAYMAYSTAGMIYCWSLYFLSIISSLLYIYQTYLPFQHGKSFETTNMNEYALNLLELIFAAIFSFDFLLSLFLADNRLAFLRRYVFLCMFASSLSDNLCCVVSIRWWIC